jgi:hypothetical protein
VVIGYAVCGGDLSSVLCGEVGASLGGGGRTDGWNERAHLFTWTKAADEILPHAQRQAISDARH